MHFARSLVALLTAFSGAATVVSARMTPTSTTHDALLKRHALKQYNPLAALEEKRGLADICVDLKVDLAVELAKILPLIGPLVSHLAGDVDLCLCVGLIPTFVQLNLVTKIAVGLLGHDVVVDALVKLLLGVSGQHQCQYPLHAVQKCTAGNPCDFTCKDGYIKQGNQCVCPAPAHECNGKCQAAACPNPSGRLSNPVRRLEGGNTFSKKHAAACPRGYSTCGVANAGLSPSQKRSYECLDTRSNLESCGGCAVALPGQAATGQDCTAISNSSSVSCSAGQCLVQSCKAGFVPNAWKSGCQPAASA